MLGKSSEQPGTTLAAKRYYNYETNSFVDAMVVVLPMCLLLGSECSDWVLVSIAPQPTTLELASPEIVPSGFFEHAKSLVSLSPPSLQGSFIKRC